MFIDVRDYPSHIEGHIEPSLHLTRLTSTLINQTPKDVPLSYTATTVTAAKSPLSF